MPPQPFHAGGAASGPLFGSSHSASQMLRDLFTKTLDVDINRVSSFLTILSFGAGVLRYAQGVIDSVCSWGTEFLTAAVTVAAKDELHDQVMNWVSVHVLEPQNTRLLTARSSTGSSSSSNSNRRYSLTFDTAPFPSRSAAPGSGPSTLGRRRPPIEYMPAFGTTWFFHDSNLFAVIRSKGVSSARSLMGPNGPGMMVSESKKDDERVTIMCLGRSPAPIKRLFDTCREFADKQSESMVTIRGCKGAGYRWEIRCQKPIRRLDTVHFDEKVKQELVKDIAHYLDPRTQNYYIRRGIPYRRGYLLYGPPGTGKSSLSLALAGAFCLDLYVLEVPSISSDSTLEQLFTSLPPYCIVLLEDIDAVGMKRTPPSEETLQDKLRPKMGATQAMPPGLGSSLTLSGLLNVLDGVASQEGRIILMTSNHPDKLDEALLRPGRIDRKVHLGHIDQTASEAMFRRMYQPDEPEISEKTILEPQGTSSPAMQEVEKAATYFASHIPPNTFTPAQVQEFLLQRHESSRQALDDLDDWVAEAVKKKTEQEAESKKANGKDEPEEAKPAGSDGDAKSKET